MAGQGARTLVLLAFALSSLATAGCGLPGMDKPLPAPGAGGAGGQGGDNQGTGGHDDGTGGAGTGGAGTDAMGCPDIFAQDLLPTYEITVSAEEWAKLNDEFLHREERAAAGLDINPYHPISFRYGAETREGAMIRLKGQSSWRHAILYDNPPKMQFVVSFNEIDSRGRFHGVRKIELDMPRSDPTFLRQRLGLYVLRSLGVAAQCANNARLVVNGATYGLYTAIERMDKEFLQRVFPGASDGDLWDGGVTLQTNETTSTGARRKALFATTDVGVMATLIDMDQAIDEWAAEAVIPDGDGYYGSGHNYFLYDHPTRGFLWLPHDLDSAVDYRVFSWDPVFWDRDEEPRPHYLAVMESPPHFARYLEALARKAALYDATTMADLQARWAAQIADAVAEDPNKPFTVQDHQKAVARQHDFFAARAGFLQSWLQCRSSGTGTDADGDGTPFCRDGADGDPAVNPGAAETCGNLLDDNCNGRIDEGCPPPPPATPTAPTITDL